MIQEDKKTFTCFQASTLLLLNFDNHNFTKEKFSTNLDAEFGSKLLSFHQNFQVLNGNYNIVTQRKI